MFIDDDKNRASAKGREAALVLFIFTIISFLFSITALYNSDVNGYLFDLFITIILLIFAVASTAYPDTAGVIVWYIITSPQP